MNPLVFPLTWTDTVGTTMDAASGLKRVYTLTVNGATGAITQSNVPAGVRYDFELNLNLIAGTPTAPATWSKGDAFPSVAGEYLITGVTYDDGVSFILRVLPC